MHLTLHTKKACIQELIASIAVYAPELALIWQVRVQELVVFAAHAALLHDGGPAHRPPKVPGARHLVYATRTAHVSYM